LNRRIGEWTTQIKCFHRCPLSPFPSLLPEIRK
jgi:hypothetical protein